MHRVEISMHNDEAKHFKGRTRNAFGVSVCWLVFEVIYFRPNFAFALKAFFREP